MRAGALAAIFLLAGCGGEDVANGNASADQIARVSTPKEEKADPQASARLQPLTAADLAVEGLAGPGCSFSRNGQMLLAAVESNAIVRTGDGIRHMVHSAPVGPTGGFFEDRQLSVSAGRIGTFGEETVGTWPARITVTNRRTEAELRLQGDWTCG